MTLFFRLEPGTLFYQTYSDGTPDTHVFIKLASNYHLELVERKSCTMCNVNMVWNSVNEHGVLVHFCPDDTVIAKED